MKTTVVRNYLLKNHKLYETINKKHNSENVQKQKMKPQVTEGIIKALKIRNKFRLEACTNSNELKLFNKCKRYRITLN